MFPSPDYRQHLDEILPEDKGWVLHNAPFDLHGFRIWMPGAEARIHRALDEGRVFCTLSFQRCIEIATSTPKGALQLDVLLQRHGLQGGYAKADSPRMFYGPLLGEPLSSYSDDDRGYAIDDAVQTLRLFHRQIEKCGGQFDWRKCVAFLTMRQYVFQDFRNYGQRTDAKHIAELEARTEFELARLMEIAQEPFPLNEAESQEVERLEAQIAAGGKPREIARARKTLDEFRVVRSNGKENQSRLRLLVNRAYSGKPPMTREAKNRKSKKPFKPQVSISHDTKVDSGDQTLIDIADYGSWSKVRNADLKMLRDGLEWPIHTKYTTADTLRIISSDPNLTNLRVAAGIREGFRPRAGFAFIEFDHSALEFVCVAQIVKTALGRGDMARQVNEGIDSHILVAKEMTGESYEDELAAYLAETIEMGPCWSRRQSGKVVNYGCLGFMTSEDSLQRYSRKYNLKEKRAYWTKVLKAWRKAQPDAVAYLERYVRGLPRTKDGRFITKIWGLGMPRWGVTLTAAANTPFQGLGACIEGLVAWAFYLEENDPTSALWGSRVVTQVHDSFVLEVPFAKVPEVWALSETIMCEAPRPFLPDVNIKAEGVVTMRVSKAAKLLMDGDRPLVWFEKGRWFCPTTGRIATAKKVDKKNIPVWTEDHYAPLTSAAA